MEGTAEVCFRSFRLDAANERLWRGTRKITLRPKTFAVLRYLVENAGRLISKDELLDAVWPDTTVSDVVPIVCVRELRKALGDDADAPRFIETMARRGYRFIAAVTAAPVQSSKFKVQSSKFNGEARDWRLETSSPFPQASSLKPQASSLVGRDSELSQLHQLLDRAMQGERQIVFIAGEPGIGKTALVDTFLRSLASSVQSQKEVVSSQQSVVSREKEEKQKATINSRTSNLADPRPPTPDPWLAHGQCIEHHGAGEAYLPLLDVTGRMCREPGGEQLIAILRQHAPTWLMQFPSLLTATDFDEVQRRTVGTTRERMLREMAEAVEVLTTIRPLVLVLEDLQWCDHSTLDFLAFLARRRGSARLLLIGTYRPTTVANNGHQLASLKHDLLLHRQCKDIALPLLTQDHIETYLDTRLPAEVRDGIPLHIWATHLQRRTDGNPLFLVNVVDYLMAHSSREDEGWSLQTMQQMLEVVPESLQQMIEKQLERLSVAEQQLLEVASVVGVEFSAAAVAAGVEGDVVEIEERCRELARHEQFLRSCGVEEWPDETVATRYGFIHSLYQQVLYQRVTEAQKARLHFRIGNRLEQGYVHTAKEHAATLARHFTHGRDYRRAVQYFHAAAENAIWRCAFQEANAHFAKGVELLQHWPDTPERTQQELRLHLTVIGPLIASKGEAAPEVEQSYAQILALHQRLGATEVPFLVSLGLWMVRVVRGELSAAQELATELMMQAERDNDPVEQLFAHFAAGINAFYFAQFATARSHFAQATTLYAIQQQPQYLLNPKMLSLSFDALTLWLLGQPGAAARQSEEVTTWAQGLSHPYNEVAGRIMEAWLSVYSREGEVVEEQVDRLLPIAHVYGFTQYRAMGTFFHGCALVEQGQTDEGVRLMSQGIEAMRATKFAVGMSTWQGMLALALGDLGRIDEALTVLTDAELVIDRNGERFFEAELWRIKGELLVRQFGVRSLEFGVENGAKCTVQSREIVASSQHSVVSREKGENHQEKASEAQSSVLSPQSFSSLNRQSAICNPQLEAEACFLKALDIARQQQAKSFELRAAMSLVRLRLQQTKEQGAGSREHGAGTALAEAHAMLSEVYGRFTEGFGTKDLQEARELLGELGKSSQ